MFVVFGIAHKQGDYNGNKYNNYVLSCMRDADPMKEEQGSIAEVLKVPSPVFESSDVGVGDTIVPMYDKFGRIQALHKQ